MCTPKIWLGKKINGLGELKRYLEDAHHTFTPTTNCDKLSDWGLMRQVENKARFQASKSKSRASPDAGSIS
jgi:hypothetical protein